MHKSDLGRSLPERAVALDVGHTDRTETRRALGAPYIGSEYWQFDLFQFSDRDIDVGFILIVPLAAWNTVNGYVLVSYDPGGHVATYATAVDTNPAYTVGPPYRLQSGEVGAILDSSENLAALFVDGARRDDYLAKQRPGQRCTLVLHSTGTAAPGFEWARLTVEVDRDLSLRPNDWFGSLGLAVPVSLAPGSHRLDIQPSIFNTLKGSSEFSCAAGELVYATIEVAPMSAEEIEQLGFHLQVAVKGSISVTTVEPESMGSRPLLIWRDGNWLVPAEPGR